MKNRMTGLPGMLDGPGETTRFNNPNGIAVSASGDTLYITDDVDKSLQIIILEDGPSDVDPLLDPQNVLALLCSPNPFSLSTTIQYDLPETTPALLEIFDATGRRVRRLFSGTETAGRHQIDWDGRDDGGFPVGNGLYYYHLETPRFANSRKIVLMR